MARKFASCKTANKLVVASMSLVPSLLAQGYKKPGTDYTWIYFLIGGVLLGLLAIVVIRKFSK